MTIDATEAIARLGIKGDVTIQETELNNPLELFMIEVGVVGGAVINAGVAPWDPYTVMYDEAAMALSRRLNPDDTAHSDVATVIAHELVHVRQMEQAIAEGRDIAAEYEEAGGNLVNGQEAYEANPFEIEAYELAPLFAPFVRVSA